MVHASRNLGPHDSLSGPNNRRWGLEKNQRLKRNFISQFRSMLAVISSYTNNLRGLHWSQQRGLCKWHARNFFRFRLQNRDLSGKLEGSRDLVLTADCLNPTKLRSSLIFKA